MRKILLALTLITAVWGGTPARFVDGRIEFAFKSIGSDPIFKGDDEEAVRSLREFRGMDLTEEYYQPTDREVEISESGLPFSGLSDFRNCVDNQEYLDDKIADLAPSKKKKVKIIQIEN